MPLVLIFVAVILLVVAYQNTVSSFASNLGTDAAGFAKWFVALALVAGLQWVPGLERMGKWLLGLILLVLVLKNYTTVFKGFTDLASAAGSAPAAVQTPASAYVANPSNPNITTAEVTGTSSSTGSTSQVASAVSGALGSYNPQTLVNQFSGFGGSGVGMG
jgi:hypothetical protein